VAQNHPIASSLLPVPETTSAWLACFTGTLETGTCSVEWGLAPGLTPSTGAFSPWLRLERVGVCRDDRRMAAVDARCKPIGEAERGPLDPPALAPAEASGVAASGLEGSEWARRAAIVGEAAACNWLAFKAGAV
jgi:hypothetical protein